MIMPDKYIPQKETLIGLGARMLSLLTQPRTINSLLKEMLKLPETGTYERFVLTLDFLYMLGAVEMKDDVIRRVN
jgi:hypothetical protein